MRDGEVVTACQAVCPTQAIRFGDGADPHSAVAQAKNSARNYVLLGELNTRPRTSYLARVRNPNPRSRRHEMAGVAEDQAAPAFALPESNASITQTISALALQRRSGRGWVMGLVLSASLTLLLVFAIGWLLVFGVGIWGLNIPVAWGFAITDYVWWIAIGMGGTFISAALYLVRQDWRNSLNRYAEAMTVFAVSVSGLFPDPALGAAMVFLLAVSLSKHHERVAAMAQLA